MKIMAALLTFSFMLAVIGCIGDSTNGTSSNAENQAAESNSNQTEKVILKDDEFSQQAKIQLPDNIPLPVGTILKNRLPEDLSNAFSIFGHVNDANSIEELENFFKENFPKHGWTINPDQDLNVNQASGTHQYLFTGENRVGSINVYKNESQAGFSFMLHFEQEKK